MDDLKTLQEREEAIIENIKKLNEQIYEAQNGVFNNKNENRTLSDEDKLIQEKIDIVQGKLNVAVAQFNIKKSALEEKILNCKSRISRTQNKIHALTKEMNFLNNNVMEFRDNVKKLENLEEETKKRKILEEIQKQITEEAMRLFQIKKTDKLKLQIMNDNCNICYKITGLEDEYHGTKADIKCRYNLIQVLQENGQDTAEKIIEEKKKPDLGIDLDVINSIVKELSKIRRIFDESTSDEMVTDQLSSLAKKIIKINMLLRGANQFQAIPKDENIKHSQSQGQVKGQKNGNGSEHTANQEIKREQPQKCSNEAMQAINQEIKQEKTQKGSQEAMQTMNQGIKQEKSQQSIQKIRSLCL